VERFVNADREPRMKVLIVGASGMIGRKLAAALAASPRLAGRPIDELILADIVKPEAPAAFPGSVQAFSVDLAEPEAARRLVAGRPDYIFHLAAIVSGEAEADFDKGYRVNLDGTRNLLEAVRQAAASAAYRPRLVFSSSIAVFGAPFPDVIADDYFTTPLTSYGTQKAIGELLVNDYSRRGFIDGVTIRLPTIVVRPGKPNAAASGFFSGILREPLNGQEATLPVSRDVRHWFASPRAAIGFLIHAAEMDTAPLGWRRAISAPGLSATVGEEIEALRRVAGESATRLIHARPDETIARIVAGWPRNFDARRALSLGFRADASMDEIIRIYIEDELGGAARAAGKETQTGT
jgi:nucleoside-diphosphate-sugar epimerase